MVLYARKKNEGDAVASSSFSDEADKTIYKQFG
jgi:hypothetical protein